MEHRQAGFWLCAVSRPGKGAYKRSLVMSGMRAAPEGSRVLVPWNKELNTVL